MASQPETQKARDGAHPVSAQNGQRQTLGKYEIRKRIGSGGMGSVFLAFDPQLRRTVALKILPREKAQNATLVKRFKAEAQAAAHLRHENIVAVYDAGEADGYLYIALEYVEGTDLQNLIGRRGPLPVKRSIEIVKHVARALQHAHERNIVHRDIKPSNMLINAEGTIKLTDMGLARSIDETTETDITRAGTTVGTVDYMAPEQARNSRAADIRSDIYSLGCAWYQMLTGKPPFSEGSVTNKLHAHATMPPPNPRDVNSEVPEALVAVMHRMMAKSPDERYQSPQELLKDLENTYISREAVSNAVLAALAEDDAPPPPPRGAAPAGSSYSPGRGTVATATAGAGAAAGTGAAAGGGAAARTAKPPVLPPKRARKPVAEPVEKRPWNLEPLKYVLAAAAIALLIWFLYWLVTGLAPDDPSSPGQDNPFAEDLRGPDGVVTPPAVLAETEKADPSNSEPSSQPAEAAEVDETTSTNEPETTTEPAETDPKKIPIGRAAERSEFPAWVGSLAPLPDEPAAESAPKPAELTVGRIGDGPPARYATLSAALADLPKSGGLVRLVGDGPFVLPSTHVQNRDLTLAAAEGSRPVVLLVSQGNPKSGADPESLLQVSGGSLALIDVHLVAVANRLPAEGDLQLVEVESGDLAVRRSSVTLLGSRTGSTGAFRISGSPLTKASPRVLLDRTIVRGEGLEAIQIDQGTVDLVCSQCLFLTGNAPILHVTNTGPTLGSPEAASEGESADAQPVNRALRFFSCTGIARGAAFVLETGRESVPDFTRVAVTNSLWAAAQDQPDSALLSVPKWPESADADSAGRLQNLDWRTEGSLYLGWDQFVSGPGSALRVRQGSEWNDFWGHSTNEAQFQNSDWPNAKIADLAAAVPGDFSAETVGPAVVRATDGGSPGCDVAMLNTPSHGRVDRAAAYASRPLTAPGSLIDAKLAREIRVELPRQDLAKIISDGDWPSGTRFVVSGEGTLKSRPIRVRGRSLRIEFVESKGMPLVIEPRNSIDFRRGGEAFISVADGHIEIVGGRFRLPVTSRGDTPETFLQVVDGGFLLEDCYVLGPMTETPGFGSLVRWRRTQADGTVSHFGQISDCFLAAEGTIVDLDAASGSLIARNSVLAALGDVFSCNLPQNSFPAARLLDVRRCTLSATQNVFRMKGAADAPDGSLPIFVDGTVFAPPLDTGANREPAPALLRVAASSRRPSNIDWWETANGYSSDLMAYLVAEAPPPGSKPQDLQEHWIAVWGEDRVVRPLAGSDGVRLQQSYPHRTKIGPRSFALGSTAQAATWGTTGEPIGADVAALPDVEVPEKPKETDDKPRRTSRPRRPGPDF